jgi:hypothetical protein
MLTSTGNSFFEKSLSNSSPGIFDSQTISIKFSSVFSQFRHLLQELFIILQYYIKVKIFSLRDS